MLLSLKYVLSCPDLSVPNKYVYESEKRPHNNETETEYFVLESALRDCYAAHILLYCCY